MVNIDIYFNYGGEWIKEPHILYRKKLYNLWRGYDSDLLSFRNIVSEYTTRFKFVGVQQLIVTNPSGRYYEVEEDVGIRLLLSLISEEFFIINLFPVDDCSYVSLFLILSNILSHFSQ
ncbi:hypothetical protein HAX54_020006 [Datura stramonium]|uniref:Uncharacterized protein n=1 Tax=Datura stramonium TaxID=4076 RepID=A0ABS8S2C6_DATST|nr:hypothetical protein [Datura stramonium]